MKNPHDASSGPSDDPTNPRYFGLPLGVIIAAALAIAAMTLVLLKYYPQ